MMNRPRPLLLLAVLLAGCHRDRPATAEEPLRSEAKSAEQSAALGYVAQDASRLAAGAPAAPVPMATAAAPASAPPPPNRATAALKLIFNASLQVEVPAFGPAALEASRIATSLGGYVSDRQSSEDGDGRKRGQITLRVPSDRFEGAVGALRNLGKVKNEGVRTDDVTKAYADLETRLKVKRETAARLREILIRQTGKVAEVLSVEREIAPSP